MKFGSLLAAVAAFVPAAAASAVVQFGAPAGFEPARQLSGALYDAVLPSGRIVTPAGASVVTGVDALGFALSPDGRYAIAANAGDRAAVPDPAGSPAPSGSSLVVVDVATMRVVDRFAAPGEEYFGGVAAVRDPADAGRTVVFAAGRPAAPVYAFDLDADGRLTPDARHAIDIGPAADGTDPFGGRSPATLLAAPDGRRIYVTEPDSDRVGAIDPATRTLTGPSRQVGFSPCGVALTGDRLLVSNEGLMRYAPVDRPLTVPPFLAPPPDPQRASSLSFVGLDAAGDLAPDDDGDALGSLAMDRAPDGRGIVGGAHPSAIALSANGAYAFVAMTNVDRIATVALTARPYVAGGTELRLFDRGPYGTQPAALARSRDGTRLYVALAGLNAVAVLDARDPLHLHRLGLIPTGATPTALVLAPDDRSLYVLNTHGFGHASLAAGDLARPGANAVWSTLERVDLATVALGSATLRTLENTRAVRASAPRYPAALRDVVVIVEDGATFDALLGDLGYGPADPRFLEFGASITPNLHALARRYGVAGNLFADATDSDAAHQWIAGGIATLYAQRSLPFGGDFERPEDYPRAGYIFNNLARHHVSFRDYGDLVNLVGYDAGTASDPRLDDPDFAGAADRAAPTASLGGRYTTDVPALDVLAGHLDAQYPGLNARIRDERRAREFIRDYGLFARTHPQPRYTHIWLPGDRPPSGDGALSAPEQVADSDRALGAIVAYFTHLRSWPNTAIFVIGEPARATRDHVDGDRTYALVISPFAKHRYVGMKHLSTVSVLKTTEQILHLPPLALGDLLATDMSDYFAPARDLRPFAAIDVPPQTAAGAALPAVDRERTQAAPESTGTGQAMPNAPTSPLLPL